MGSTALVPTSQELSASVASFGNVLQSVGFSVADSQSSLDQGVVDTVQQMNNTQIDVITDVILQLDDNGEPSANQPAPLKKKLSLLNFFTPTVHQWQHVSLSMDLTLSALHYEHGMMFNQSIKQDDQITLPYPWGFLGWFKTDVNAEVSRSTSTDGSSQFHQDADWAEGQVRVDALLAPRRTTKFPIPAEVSIGPQIYFNQGSIAETTTKDVTKQQSILTQRSTTFTITVLKQDGSVNGGKELQADAGGFLVSFASDSTFKGTATNTAGQVQLTVSRDLRTLPNTDPVQGTLTITLGQMTKSVKVRI